MNVAVCITTHKRVADTSLYLPKIVDSVPEAKTIFIWDNNSDEPLKDWLSEFVRSRKDERIKVHFHQENIGEEAHRRMMEETDEPYLLKIDPDVELPKDFVPAMVSVLRNDEEAGAVALNLRWGHSNWVDFWFHKATERQEPTMYDFESVVNIGRMAFLPTLEFPVRDKHGWKEILPGACRMVKREALEKFGGFPTGLIYGADNPVTYGVRLSGYRCGILRDFIYLHHHRTTRKGPPLIFAKWREEQDEGWYHGIFEEMVTQINMECGEVRYEA